MRFPQYTSTWTKKPLKTLVKMFKGSGISKEQLSTTGSSCILYGELYTTYHDEVISEITSKTNIYAKGLVKSKSNDIIIPSSGETAIDIATARCVLCDNVYLGGDLNILRPYSDNGCFISYQLNGKRKFDIARVAQGASIVHLHNEHIENLNIYLPENSKEQEDIVHLMMLVDKKINTQSKIIDKYKSLIIAIRDNVINTHKEWNWIKLSDLINDNIVTLMRGNIIPKHDQDAKYKYPVYSSSIHNNGLMGYSDSYMYNEELITWSIDGGGHLFHRKQHQFSVTNVCGVMKLDLTKYNYRFASEVLKHQHSKLVFDYQTKAHPSIINKLYKLPDISLKEQLEIVNIFDDLYSIIEIEEKLLKKLKEQKKYLLSNMFI